MNDEVTRMQFLHKSKMHDSYNFHILLLFNEFCIFMRDVKQKYVKSACFKLASHYNHKTTLLSLIPCVYVYYCKEF